MGLTDALILIAVYALGGVLVAVGTQLLLFISRSRFPSLPQFLLIVFGWPLLVPLIIIYALTLTN